MPKYQVVSLTNGTVVTPTPWREKVRKRLVLFLGRRLLCPFNRHLCTYGPMEPRNPVVVCFRCDVGWEEMPKGSVWKGRP